MAEAIECPRCHERCAEPEGPGSEVFRCGSCHHRFTVAAKGDDTGTATPHRSAIPSGTAIPGRSASGTDQGEGPPEKMGPYVLKRKLGAGTMGEVWLAYDPTLERDVAVKILPSAFSEDADRLKRFLREARLAAKLDHPNTVPIYQAGLEGNRAYIAMQYVGGGNLEDATSGGGHLPWHEATRIIREAAAGLGAAHHQGLVHRDVKPANLMRTTDGAIKVVDFGLARAQVNSTQLTQLGMRLGSPAYMAPEQWKDQEVDARADLYALTCSYYEILTGRLPFDASTLASLGHQHCNEPLPDPRQFVPGLPEGVCRILIKGMQKEPERRHQNAAELAAELHAVLASPDDATAPDTPWQELTERAASSRDVQAAGSWKRADRAPRPQRSKTAWGRRIKRLAVAILCGACILALGMLLLIRTRTGTVKIDGDTKPVATTTRPAPETTPAVPTETTPTRRPGIDEASRALDRAREALLIGAFDRVEEEAGTAAKADPSLAEAYAYRAWSLIEEEQYEQALADAQKALALDKGLLWAEVLKGMAQRGVYDRAGATSTFQDAAQRLNPQDAAVWHLRGEAYAGLGKSGDKTAYAKALADFEQAASMAPRWPQPWIASARVHTALRAHDRAEADYSRAVAIGPPSAQALAGRGEALAARGHLGEAESDLLAAKLLSDGPQKTPNAATLRRRGCVLCHLASVHAASYDESLAAYDGSLRVRSGSADAEIGRAQVFLARREYDSAIGACRRAMSLDAGCAAAYSLLAEAHCSKGDHRRAVEELTEAIRLEPDEPEHLLNRASVYHWLKETENARADAREALRLIEPRGSWDHRRRARAWRLLGRYDAAMMEDDKAIEADPKDAAAYTDRGVMRQDKGEYDAAIADYTKTIELYPRSALAYRNRGMCYVDKKDYDRAIADCSRAIELYPEDAITHRTRGISHGNKQQYNEALADLDKAIELDANDVPAYVGRAMCHIVRRDFDLAITDCSRAIELDPSVFQPYEVRAGAYEQTGLKKQAEQDRVKARELKAKLGDKPALDIGSREDSDP